MNMKIAAWRKDSVFKKYPVIEVIIVAFITALINYPVVFMRFFSLRCLYNFSIHLINPVATDHNPPNSSRPSSKNALPKLKTF
jgi:hypothetical protein